VTALDATPVTDPSELGIDKEALAALVARAQADVDAGIVPSCQLALARDGRIAAAVTLGDAVAGSRYVIFSATKPIVASAMWILIGEGAIDVNRRIADYIPEFGPNGKDVITVEQVMLHTSGFPHAPFLASDWDDREARLARFSAWRCNWEPGTAFEYHATSAHWVLAELIERASGQDFREYLRARVIGPLGLTRLQVGAPVSDQGDINTLVNTGEPATAEELMAVLGIPELPVTEVTPEALLGFNAPAVRAVGVPGGGGVSTASDLALFYQGLLHNPVATWKPDVLTDVRTAVRNRFPDFLGTPSNRSLGLVLAGDDGRSNLRGMGKTVSPGTFGHNGAGGQIAWADPATGLSFVYLTNGMDQHPLRQARRTTALASRAAVCATG
jgi:CubicO group peptidase (beta-lactamase class C family)